MDNGHLKLFGGKECGFAVKTPKSHITVSEFDTLLWLLVLVMQTSKQARTLSDWVTAFHVGDLN